MPFERREILREKDVMQEILAGLAKLFSFYLVVGQNVPLETRKLESVHKTCDVVFRQCGPAEIK